MAAAVGVQAAGQAVRGERLQQPGEGRGGAFLRHPDMPRRILMQHHPRQRPARPLAAVRPPALRPGQQAAPLQQRLGPGGAPAEALAHQMLVDVFCREARIFGPVQHLHTIRLGLGRTVVRRIATPPVGQTRRSLLAIPLRPSAER